MILDVWGVTLAWVNARFFNRKHTSINWRVCQHMLAMFPTTQWFLRIFDTSGSGTTSLSPLHRFCNTCLKKPHKKSNRFKQIPSWGLTYPLPRYFWVDDFPFPQVGYVIFPWRVCFLNLQHTGWLFSAWVLGLPLFIINSQDPPNKSSTHFCQQVSSCHF